MSTMPKRSRGVGCLPANRADHSTEATTQSVCPICTEPIQDAGEKSDQLIMENVGKCVSKVLEPLKFSRRLLCFHEIFTEPISWCQYV